MWPELHWLRPEMAWLALPAVLLWLLFWRFRRVPSVWQQWIAPHLQHRLFNGTTTQQPQKALWLLLFWLLLVLALCGPSLQKIPQPVYQLKKATVLVMDMSLSMHATDLSPDRVTQARFKAMDFLEGVQEGEVALISFAGDAFVISPLTQDKNNLKLLLPTLSPDIMPVQGSNLTAALRLAAQLLQQGNYSQGDVVLFTDGFSSRDYAALRDQLDNYPHRVSVLAFGSAEGAPVRLSNGELLKDNQGAIVLPKVPLLQLQQLALQKAGVFAQAQPDDSDIRQLWQLPDLTSLQDEQQPSQLRGEQWQDNAVYLVWLLLAFWLWQKKQGQLLALLLCVYLPQSHALDWQDLWLNQQQQAKQAYEQQDYSSAWQQFDDPLWKGNAAYRAGDFAAAEKSYRQASGPDASYNLGNSLAQQQRFDEAIQAYEDTLAHQPDHANAAHNLEQVKKALEQQKQQESQDQKQQGDSNEQQSQGDPSQEQNAENKSQQSENSEQSSEQNQSSGQGDKDPEPQAGQHNDPQQQAQNNEQQQQQEQKQAEQQESAQQKQQAISEAWPNASPEQSQQLDNLLRKVQDDPSLLLKRKMALEYQKRRFEQASQGVLEEW
ncbi:VWA domain-containing protein [Rheinheimera sp.]|uniref:VWA domain-containing protein n=1 Tax=Rheinheimera sp. TaxID=1869214 RepID=UPI00307D9850